MLINELASRLLALMRLTKITTIVINKYKINLKKLKLN